MVLPKPFLLVTPECLETLCQLRAGRAEHVALSEIIRQEVVSAVSLTQGQLHLAQISVQFTCPENNALPI